MNPLRTAFSSLLLLPLATSCETTMAPLPHDPFADRRPDPHSWSRPDEWRVTHLELDWEVDFEARRLAGEAVLEVERAGVNARPRLVLDTRALAVERVEVQAAGAPWEETPWRVGEPDAILGAPLEIDLPGEVERVRVRYATSPAASGLQWLEPSQTAGGERPFLFSQAQAIHARSFVPCQDSPGVRTTFAARVRAPEGLRAVMAAEQLGSEDGTTWRFRMPQPVPAYLLAIAVGELEFRELGERCGVYAEPALIEAAAYEFADTEEMLAAVERSFGPYRWGRYDLLVLPPSFPFGGMENPRLTFVTPTILAGDRSLVALIAHELAHSWSGNLVTNATWNDFWLNEGFTVHLERRILEALFGAERAELETALGMRDLEETIEELLAKRPEDTRLALELAGRDPDDGMTDVAYEKGAAFLRRVEELAGRGDFDPFLRAWFDERAFRSATTAEFVRFLEERLLADDATVRTNLDVEEWIHGEGLPQDAPRPRTAALEAIEATARAFVAGERPASEVPVEEWSALETLLFVRSLGEQVDPALLAELDASFSFTESRNSEILAAWLELAVRSGYDPADEALVAFLKAMGRRKFLKPLYAALAASPEGLARAREIYREARPLYHGIARGTVEEILGER